MDTLLNKILNYESTIFNEYKLKRKILIDKLSKIETNKLDKQQLLIFINDIKDVIDPIMTSSENIDHLLMNLNFKNQKSFDNACALKNLILFNYLFKFFLDENSTEESVETELTESSSELSDSNSDSSSELSDSSSELSDSKSDSLTFSRNL